MQACPELKEKTEARNLRTIKANKGVQTLWGGKLNGNPTALERLSTGMSSGALKLVRVL